MLSQNQKSPRLASFSATWILILFYLSILITYFLILSI